MITLRPDQEKAVDAIAAVQRGIVKAPAGSGKTIIAAAAIRSLVNSGLSLKVVWFAHTTEQCEQAMDALKLFFPEGGSGTEVACYQSKITASGHNLVILDECHHIASPEFRKILDGYDGPRWGFSATPERGDDLRDDVFKLIGPIVHTVEREGLVEAGKLLNAKVYFHAPNEKDELNDGWFDEKVQAGYDKMKYSLSHVAKQLKRDDPDMSGEEALKAARAELLSRARWHACQKYGIFQNEKRNDEIVLLTQEYCEDSILILVGSVDHGKLLQLFIPDSLVLHSKMGDKKRRDAMEAFRNGVLKCAIATSLADEGLDVPRANVLILAAAGRSKGKAEQRTGRVLRAWGEQTHGIVHDFWDWQHPMLMNQSRARARVYASLGYEFVGGDAVTHALKGIGIKIHPLLSGGEKQAAVIAGQPEIGDLGASERMTPNTGISENSAPPAQNNFPVPVLAEPMSSTKVEVEGQARESTNAPHGIAGSRGGENNLPVPVLAEPTHTSDGSSRNQDGGEARESTQCPATAEDSRGGQTPLRQFKFRGVRPVEPLCEDGALIIASATATKSEKNHLRVDATCVNSELLVTPPVNTSLDCVATTGCKTAGEIFSRSASTALKADSDKKGMAASAEQGTARKPVHVKAEPNVRDSNSGDTTLDATAGETAFHERKHARLSPSTLKAKAICSGFINDPQGDKTASIRGTLGHKAVERENPDLCGDDVGLRTAVEKCLKYRQRVFEKLVPDGELVGVGFKEVRFEYFEQWGFCDEVVFDDEDRAEMFDWKFAYNFYPADAPQFWAYCLGAWNKWPELQTIKVHVAHPFLNEIDIETFTRAEHFSKFQVNIKAIMAKVERNDPADYRITEQCAYCGFAGKCVKLANLGVEIGARYANDLVLPDGPLHGSEVTDPKAMAALQKLSRIMEKAASGWRRAGLEMYDKGVDIPGYKEARRGGKRSVASAAGAYKIVKERFVKDMPPEQFLEHCTVTATGLDELVSDTAPRGDKEKAVQRLAAYLEDEDLLARGGESRFLMPIRGEEKDDE